MQVLHTIMLCWFILIGSFYFDKNASISGNFYYNDFQVKDIEFSKDFQKNITEYILQYGKD
jgi:hypothetical protein